MVRFARLLLRFLLTAALGLALWPGLVAAANDTPETAIVLTAAHNSASDTLVGSPGGAYRYYRFHYQGGSAPAQVTLTFEPGYGSTGSQAVGFNLYGPSGLSFAGQNAGTNGNVSTAQYTLAFPAAMDVLVQVYNYTAGMSVSYTLTVAGISGGSTAGLVASRNTTPEQALSVTTINAALGGTLVGNAAGAFQYFTLRYPGGETPMTITMNASPTYNGAGLAYGFNIYRTNALTGQSQLVASGVPIASDVNSTTLSATITNRAAATYQLQVVNYWPGVAVTYGISATGLAGPAPAASGNGDASHAIVLNSARPGATATLAGNSGGAFHYYLVQYPGSQSQLAIAVTYTSSLGGINLDALGFNVYNGSQLVTTSHPADDGFGVLAAEWRYADPNPATFGIQVFNYAPGTSVSYTIYQVGSR
jgi:hypothetical protein